MKSSIILGVALVFFSIDLISKSISCVDNKFDSSLCYSNKKYIKPKIHLDIKIKGKDSTWSGQIPLIGDMDNDCIPDFFIFGSDRGIPGKTIDTSRIRIINSKDGILKKNIDVIRYDDSNSSPAIADVDNDGILEIIVCSPDGSVPYAHKLLCYEVTGKLKWFSNDVYRDINWEPGRSNIGVADFNQDGISEVYCNNRIFNAQTGVLLAEGGLNGYGSNYTMNAITHQVSVAAQLDDDTSDLELAAGYTIYKVKITNKNGRIGNSMAPLNVVVDNKYLDGKTAVADINLDGKLDVIVSYGDSGINSRIYAYTLINGTPTLLAKNYIPGAHLPNGCPTIGDIDANGIPDILVVKSNAIHCYEYNGSTVLLLKWSFNLLDDGGYYSGTTIFDLNADGINEIVYKGDSLLYIIDGSISPPQIISSIQCWSYGLHDYPLIADIDNSGYSSICTICGTGNGFGRVYGYLTIFGPPDDSAQWAPARPIWNQYAYNPLYINDDLTVPQFQKNQATYKNGKYNNFMQQESLLDSNNMYKVAAASLYGKIQCINYDHLSDEFVLTYDVYNKSNASRSTGDHWFVTFYNGNPESGGILIDSILITRDLQPGDSLMGMQLRIKNLGVQQIFLVINTNRINGGKFTDQDFQILECDYTDNIFQEIEFPKIDSTHAVICKGATYQFLDTAIQDAGRYYRKLKNVNGCDSLVFMLTLSTVDTIYTSQSLQVCDSYSWNHQLLTQSGTYQFDTLNQFGCDSIVSLDLKVNPSSSSISQHTSCNSYSWNGMIYNASGMYTYKTTNSVGCDSIATLELVIHKSDSTLMDVTTCNNYIWNGKNYLQSGIYTLDTINQFGCDSLVQLNLNLNSIINKNILQTACDSYNWNGRNITQSGIYMDTTISSKGCDSITTLQLIINKSVSSNTVIKSCDSYNWNGMIYTQSGNYSFTTQNSNGCDSIANLQLTIHKSSNSITNISSCNSYSWNNITYTQSGSYPYQTVNANGCDSIATLNLTINKADSILMKQTACNSYHWNNKTYTQSGKYVFQTTNVKACDSIVMLDLTINSSTTKDTSRTICDSLNFLGKTLKTSGHYSFTIPNTQGCDSMINLSLIISSQHYKDSVSNCGSYIWPINGRSYDSSGVYVEKYSNVAGCDSIYLLNLKVNKNYELKEKADVCKEYIWLVNNQAYTQSGEYIYNLKSTQGCDSVLKLDLTIHPEFHHTDTIIANSDYLWPVNKQIYPSSGSYEEDYTSSQGCDSIHLLLLTINKEVSIYYPNVIHPGGINEWFTIFVYGSSASIKVLSIYDRWGSLVWQKESFPPNELQQGWNGLFKGQKALPGVYVWKAEIELSDGRIIVEKGDVTLFR